MKFSQQSVCSRFMALGVTKTASHQLVVQLEKWNVHNGEEWTVNRLKEIKLMYLHKIAGQPYNPKVWIAKGKDGLPKGAIRPLFSLSRKNFSKVLTAFQSYSAYVAERPTINQKKKFFDSMTSSDQRGLTTTLVPVFGQYNGKIPRTPTVLEYSTSPNKRAPHPKGRTGPETDHLEVTRHAMLSECLRTLITKSTNRVVFDKIIPVTLSWKYLVDFKDPMNEIGNNLGHISGIQEPGYKLRAIANPSRILQCALEPLKVALGRFLRANVPTDCTFDQQRAIPIVQSWLKSRRTVYSVDLSDATNLFPWPLQRELLKDTFPQPEFQKLIEIMDFAATGPWLSRLRGYPEIVRFTRGQPLGLGPSFFTFALAHNTLLQGICEMHGIEPRFLVLGDDVVIADSKLNRIYRATLRNLGCKVSESKTIESKVLAEFAGTIVMADRAGHGYKWRQMSDYSFIEAARNLGKSSLGMMNPEQRAVTNLLAPLPKWAGGIGWSDGRKISDLSSPIYDYAVMHMVNKEEQTPMLYRDLVSDAADFIHSICYANPSGGDIVERLFADVVVRDNKIVLSSLIRSSRLNDVKIQPMPKFIIVDQGVTPPHRYYPVAARVGDPRPSILPLIRTIASLSGPGELESKVISWLKDTKRVSSVGLSAHPFCSLPKLLSGQGGQDPSKQSRSSLNERPVNESKESETKTPEMGIKSKVKTENTPNRRKGRRM